MSSDDLVELVSRGKQQDPPPWVVWEALSDPSQSTRGWLWFDVQPDEQTPEVLSLDKPRAVVWSSIWPDRPDLQVSFEIEASGPGSFVTWRLLGAVGTWEPDDVKRCRYRLNQLVNGNLREYFDC